MDWQWFVWRGLGSRWARKTVAGSITALVTWSLLWGPLVEWRQQQITQRMEQLVWLILDDPGLDEPAGERRSTTPGSSAEGGAPSPKRADPRARRTP